VSGLLSAFRHPKSLLDYRVGQARLIFKIKCRDEKNPLNDVPLVYVHWFSKPAEVAEDVIKMYLVERSIDLVTKERYGAVVPQSSIARFVQLIPQFGKRVDRSLTASNSLEQDGCFYINSFGDKEIYQSVY
jgi:hypothetical protein